MNTVFLDLIWLFLRFVGLFRPTLVVAPGGKLYLKRWYLTPDTVWYRKRFPAIFLHCFYSSDPDRGWHSHPWIWSWSMILRGSYKEFRVSPCCPGSSNMVNSWNCFWPGDKNKIDEEDFHRVKLLTPKVWTLFVAGPLHGRQWEFMDENGVRRPHGTETPGD